MVFLHSWCTLFDIALIVLAHRYFNYPTFSADGLKIEELNVPQVVQKGRDYELGCDYHLNSSETLYALRWYKDDKEFFRYMPKETPTRRTFDVNGVKINMTLSSSSSVVLVNVETASSGNYRCEVSIEAPSFETDVEEAPFIVLEKPIGNPFITASRGMIGVTVNEPIVANCSGPEGQPAPQLFWTLDNYQIPNDDRLVTYWVQDGVSEGNLERTTSMLHLPADWVRSFAIKMEKLRKGVTPHSFVNVLPLRCTSHIKSLFEQSDFVNIRVISQTASTTQHPVVLSNRDVNRSPKSTLTLTSSYDDTNTSHGAFKNNSPSFHKRLFNGWTTGVRVCCSLLLVFSWTKTQNVVFGTLLSIVETL